MADLPSILKTLVAPPGTDPQDAATVSNQMQEQFGPQESTINSAIKTIGDHLASDTVNQQKFGQIADQKISEVGNTLASQLQGHVGAIGDIYKQGGQQVGAAYDQAGNVLGQAGASIQGALGQGASNLGLGQALQSRSQFDMNPMARLQANLGILQGRNAEAKAGSTANLATLGTQLQGIAQKAVGDSQQNYAQKRADLATDVLKTIGQLQVTSGESTQKLMEQFSNLAATEGPAFRNMLNQVTSARTAAESKAALDNLNTQIKLAGLGIQQQNANTKATTAAATNDPNSLANQLKAAQLTGANYTNATNAAKPMSISDSEGNANLQQFIEGSNFRGTWKGGLQRFINQNAATAGALGKNPYEYLIQLAQSKEKDGKVELPTTPGSKFKSSDYQIPTQQLLDAITARYTNVGSAVKVGTKVK